MTVRAAVRVEGIVQGVGFRPFVFGLARSLGLTGVVGNDAQGVFVEVQGDPDAVEQFRARLVDDAPPLAVIERVVASIVELKGDEAFVIVPSEEGGERHALISPDTATCDDCLREIDDPSARRHRYPFTNCTNCGPRLTIVRDVPYDRPATTMSGFPMCDDCSREYHDPADRRFHAQPVCCPACGPRLRLVDASGATIDGDPIERAAGLLGGDRVLAVKGIGGYHLAALASSEIATGALRTRKHREEKPFAVMVGDLAAARELCDIDDAEERILRGRRRPIVLLRRCDDGGKRIAAPVAPGNRFLGLMLPYTPLHHLLAGDVGEPLVLTSGNRSDEPIAYRDDDAFERLGSIAEAFLTHDRPIHVRADDSVTRVFRGVEMPLRRARGYAPQPVPLPVTASRPVLGCGAELKSTFCLAKGSRAFVSHHIGDLETYETFRSYVEAIDHYRRLFDVDPAVVAHDLHPDYLSTKHAMEIGGVEHLAVQHHHAHVASCLADNGEQGPAIGVAFDGLGFGPDGTIWGGEWLVAGLASYERAGRFAPVPMPGGAAAIREPWRMAAAYLDAAFDGATPDALRRPGPRWEHVVVAARAGVNAPLTSSAGRLFDAVAALCGIRDEISYEGQAAIELEQRADPSERGAYRAAIDDRAEAFEVRGADLVRAAAEDVLAGAGSPVVAARFHNAVAAVVLAGCRRVRDMRALHTVALSGGVFQNMLLLHRVTELLESDGFEVLTHRRVPPNDGGISLGQVAIAIAQQR